MSNIVDINTDQLELLQTLIDRWLIEIDDGYKWAEQFIPPVIRSDYIGKLDEALTLALSVKELLKNDD